MKKTIKCAIVLFLPLLLVSSSYSMDLRLILSGGYGSLRLEELNRSLLDWAEWQKEKAIFRENWDYHGEEVRKLSSGYDIGGELIAFFTPRIAAGIGAGFIYGELTEENIELFVDVNARSYALTRPAKVSAIPLVLSAFYFYPISNKLDIFIKGGMGLIWTKFIERAGNKSIRLEDWEAGKLEAGQFNYLDEEFIDASARDSIFLGGLGLIYEVDPSLSFFIEGEARMAKINGFQGETPEGDPGELYFFEEYSSDIDFWQAKYKMLTEAPSGDDFRSVRKATVDLSGFSVKIGLLIKF